MMASEVQVLLRGSSTAGPDCLGAKFWLCCALAHRICKAGDRSNSGSASPGGGVSWGPRTSTGGHGICSERNHFPTSIFSNITNAVRTEWNSFVMGRKRIDMVPSVMSPSLICLVLSLLLAEHSSWTQPLLRSTGPPGTQVRGRGHSQVSFPPGLLSGQALLRALLLAKLFSSLSSKCDRLQRFTFSESFVSQLL